MSDFDRIKIGGVDRPVDFPGGVYVNGVQVIDTSGVVSVITTITFGDGEYLGDTNGNELVKFAVTASAVNELSVTNAATGNAPSLSATGGDTNIGLILKGKGTGAVRLGQATSSDVRLEADQPIADSSGNEYFKFSKAASAVNEITVANAATGNGVSLSATGGDTNIAITLAGKGTGRVSLGQATSAEVRLEANQPITDSAGKELIKFVSEALAVNEVTISNAATTSNGVSVSATGDDANVAITLKGKGTGAVLLGQATSAGVDLVADQALRDSSGNEFLKFSKAASAVNEFTLANAATGSGVSFTATGGDTNISATLAGKGTGAILLGQATCAELRLVADQPITDSSGNEFIKFSKAATAVNEITVANAATGSGVSVSATGGDTNISATFAGKGTGAILIGQATCAELRLVGDQPITDSSGNELVKFTKTASAVNEVTIANAATGNAPLISATGGDANVGLDITSKGTGSITLWSNAMTEELLVLHDAATAVNQLGVTPSATGSAVLLEAEGGDTNIPISLAGKGTGYVSLGQATSSDVRLAADQPIADSSGNEFLKFSKAATAVNEFTIANAATGSGVSISATGGDTNIDVTLAAKGTGTLLLGQATATGIKLVADQPILDSASNELIKFVKTASAVNEITIANQATGSGPSITSTGGDTNIAITLAGKGTGAVLLGQATSTDVRLVADQAIADSSGNEFIKFSKTASAVNELTITNGATGGGVGLSATGDDANISITLAGKGTGAVRIGQGTSTGVILVADQPILDSNSNEQIKFVATGSAVNEFTVTNAATGNAPKISATGGDTNINLALGGKGTGIVRLDGGTAPNAVSAVGGAATSNAQVSVVTSEALTTAADGTYTLTLTNDKVATTSACFVTLAWGTNSQGRPVIEDVTPGAGSLVVVVRNYAAATALNGTIIFNVLVL